MNFGLYFQPVFTPISDQILATVKCIAVFGWCWYENLVLHEIEELVEVFHLL